MDKRIQKLTPEQRALLLQRLQKARTEVTSEIQPRPKGNEPLPLSFAQQRIWLHERIAASGSLYLVPLAMRLRGTVNREALAQSLQEIVRRHEALRTTIVSIDGQPRQVIAAPFALPLAFVAVPAEQTEVAFLQMLQEEACRPFDLARGPLLRATLFRLGPQEHVFLLSLHHIVCDGWSRGVLFRELTALYEAYSRGQPSPLAELPLQYADFALWQRRQTEVFEQHLTYWRQHLLGAPVQLQLPTDRPRSPVQTFAGARQPIHLATSEVEALKRLGQQEDCTLFMILLTAFTVLLSRYTSQEDVVIGVPIANRNRTELEHMIGFFVNTLVLRSDLRNGPTVRQLLRRIRENALGAFAHQDLPFERLVEVFSTQRNVGHAPLFQVAFVLQNAPMTPLALAGLTLEPFEIDIGVALFDLTLALIETEQGLTGYFEYNRDLFSAATMARMVEHWHVLLLGLLAAPERSIATLPLLTPAEQRQLILEGQVHHVAYAHACIHQMFEQQVARTPDTVAVTFGQEQMTYQALNQRANQLARYLQERGVGPEIPVGVCCERSLEMLIAMLGILKAGGAYVPLDPAYPRARLEFMLADTGISLVLTLEHLQQYVPDVHITTLCLDTHWPEIGQASTTNVQSEVGGAHLAYIIYTSGSTGNPKGVLIQHEGVVAFCAGNTEIVGITRSDRILQYSTINFDAAVEEIFSALYVGATLCLAPPDLVPGEPLAQFIRKQGITKFTAPPSLLAILSTALPSVRLVLSAGEVCTEEIARRWAAEHQLANIYGPTEITVAATCAPRVSGESKPTIGRVLPYKRLYVIDANVQLVPSGTPGELCIGGLGVARGYLHLPALTAERFIPDPFSSEPGARLYRTGDLVRLLPNGEIDFLGRLDHQVKLRGYRIELGEIETMLLQHEAVRECLVTVHDESSGDKRLVAYLTIRHEPCPSASELRHFLRERLPDYMLPAVFVHLEAFPLNSNGKVDRAALPDPMISHLSLTQSPEPPQYEQERLIATLWQEILGMEQVGVHDTFFDLGGHSLSLVQLQERLQTTFHQNIQLLDLFKYPTIRSFADFLQQREVQSQSPTTERAEQLQAGKIRRQQRLASSQENHAL